MAAKVFSSEGIVLGKQGSGEANTSALILMRAFGLVRVRAQTARVMKAKLRFALEPYTLGQYSFVRGAQANRLVGASVEGTILSPDTLEARKTAGKIGRLLLRLLPGEDSDPELFEVVKDGFGFLSKAPEELIADGECVLVLSILGKLGYLPESASLSHFAQTPLTGESVREMAAVRTEAIRTINHVLSISGL